MKNSSKKSDNGLNERLSARGFRFTPQREHVYQVLLEARDHPTAERVFIRAKQEMPEISMATVYNCLDALVNCGLVRLVNLDRTATRYCPNMKDHHHFYCDHCGGTYDIDLLPHAPKPRLPLPKGFKASRYDITIRGICPRCGEQKSPPPHFRL